MQVVVGRHTDKARWGWLHVASCCSTSQVQGEDTDVIRSHRPSGAQLWVDSSRNWSVFMEGLDTGRHEKAPV